jgi:hypothetical protein
MGSRTYRVVVSDCRSHLLEQAHRLRHLFSPCRRLQSSRSEESGDIALDGVRRTGRETREEGEEQYEGGGEAEAGRSGVVRRCGGGGGRRGRVDEDFVLVDFGRRPHLAFLGG